MKKVNVVTGILVLSISVLLSVLRVNAEEIQLYAKCAVLMDADSGRILYGKNSEEIMPMASTTKIMTLLVTLEHADLNEIVTVSDYAASMPDVQLHIKSGEQYYLGDLVYSMMLESHNDSAVAIAEHVGKDVKGFAKMMNEKAKEIGCVNTWYITPNGLDAEEMDEMGNVKIHATTARELALVMSYCITNDKIKEQFMKITQTEQYSFSSLDGKRTFYCVNHNALLNMMEGVMSGKTGYTAKAGYCYVCAVENEGRHFVVALLACGWPNHKTYKWSDTRKLLEYGMDEYKLFDLRTVKIDTKKLLPVLICRDANRTYRNVHLQYIEKNLYSDVILVRINDTIRQDVEQVRQMTMMYDNQENVGEISIYVGNEKVKTIILSISAKTTKK